MSKMKKKKKKNIIGVDIKMMMNFLFGKICQKEEEDIFWIGNIIELIKKEVVFLITFIKKEKKRKKIK